MSDNRTDGKPDYASVREIAEAKCLDPAWLRKLGVADAKGGGILIPYYGETGEVLLTRERGTARCRGPGIRFYQPMGSAVHLYGLNRLDQAQRAGHVWLAEGESDAWALWAVGLPALGLPGKNTARKAINEQTLEGIADIFLLPDNEPPGDAEKLIAAVADRLAAIGWTGRLWKVAVPADFKDVSDWRAADPERFKESLTEALRHKERIPLPSPAANGKDGPSPTPWKAPVSLAEPPDVPSFPLDVLPGPLANLVNEIAWAMNCAPDLAAVAMLTLAGGAVANARHLAITRSHVQSPCLFAAVVAPPGMTKSPPLRILRRPFDQAESEARAAWKSEVDKWKKEPAEDRGDKPALQRCLVSNITTESLRITLDETPRGVLMIRNELSGLIAGFNQYKSGGGDDRQFYLDLWDGTPIINDRKSDRSREGAPVFVLDAFTAIYGTIQPDVIARLQAQPRQGAAPLNDGFLDRWLFACPKDVPAIGEQWREVSEDASEQWANVVKNLLSLLMTKDPGKPCRPARLKLSACGKAAWERFTNELAAEMNDEDFPAYLRGPWVKLRAYGARLALIHQCLRWALDGGQLSDVDGKSMEAGARLVNYFKAHARKVYLIMDADPALAGARRLLRWLQKQRCSSFTKRDAFSPCRPTFKTVPDMDPALAILERHNLIRRVETPERSATGRPRSEEYEVHPNLPDPRAHNSQNAQNCLPRDRKPSFARSANCARGGQERNGNHPSDTWLDPDADPQAVKTPWDD